MSFKKSKFTPLLLLPVLFVSASVEAGPFTDKLETCLLRSTSLDDKRKLVNWVFRMAAQHPEIKNEIGDVYTPAQLTKADVNMAEIVSKLTLKSCRSETREAFLYEEECFGVAFESLGAHAMSEIMTNESVEEASQAWFQYFDEKKLGQLLLE